MYSKKKDEKTLKRSTAVAAGMASTHTANTHSHSQPLMQTSQQSAVLAVCRCRFIRSLEHVKRFHERFSFRFFFSLLIQAINRSRSIRTIWRGKLEQTPIFIWRRRSRKCLVDFYFSEPNKFQILYCGRLFSFDSQNTLKNHLVKSTRIHRKEWRSLEWWYYT